MATATNVVTHLYDTYDQATSVVRDLETAGVASNEISIIANQEQHDDDESSGAATGAKVGTTIGAGAGLLAGLGMMAIPGIGPVVAAGWLASTALGAVAGLATGGILGSLTDIGVSDDHAHVYAEGIRRGGTLVSVRTATVPRSNVVGIMAKYDPVDPAMRGDEYRQDGWKRFEDRVDNLTQPDRPLR
jgi:uncharacterized membrane protein